MAIDLFRTKGTPLDRQLFTWRDLVQAPYKPTTRGKRSNGTRTRTRNKTKRRSSHGR